MNDPLTQAMTRPWPPSLEDELTSVEVCAEAATHLAETECVVENDRDQVDWERTIERLETWYRLNLPTDSDANQYKIIRKSIRKVRSAAQ
jgi:hypothetical protein